MIFNDEIRVQRKITRKTGFLFILDNIRRNTNSHDKKENKKRNIVSHRNETDIKRGHTRKPRIRISEETMNISKR